MATTINIVSVALRSSTSGGSGSSRCAALRRILLALCRPIVTVWLVGAMGVDRSDRKLINDAPAALRIEDRLLSSPASPSAQREVWLVYASRR
jgi:hypothetical protein